MLDIKAYRAIVYTLCFICSSVVVGGVVLSPHQDRKMPQELNNLASICVGSLIGLLAPSPRKQEP
ncbi:hypothetical protein [Microcoleus sp. D3_18a_C4]|uniref:hypothetical protein n=1 Tax=Microcoleus sp. D3_18a_C4 TaxID=3055332 RepID=UPI002FCEC757